jgi:ribonuclease D
MQAGSGRVPSRSLVHMEIRMVQEPGDVTAELARLDVPVVGVDVERANGHSYTRPAALVQVGAPGRCVLLDAVVLPDLRPLEEYLRGRFTVLHAIENDIPPLRDAGVDVIGDGAPHERVADTGIAAALLGLPTGLGSLLAEFLEVELSPDKERYQRADWTARPLDPAMIDYAAEDAVHLPALWSALVERLRDAERMDWYEQELAATIAHERDNDRAWVRTKGAGRLDGRGRTMLRALWEERERIATTEDIAPQRIAKDEALVSIAEDPPPTIGVMKRGDLRRQQVEEFGERFLAVMRDASDLPDEPALFGSRRATDDDRAAHDRMRKARARIAKELGVESGVLCPSRVLRDAVLADPETPQEMSEVAGLRPWQRELLEDVLWEAYTGRKAED